MDSRISISLNIVLCVFVYLMNRIWTWRRIEVWLVSWTNEWMTLGRHDLIKRKIPLWSFGWLQLQFKLWYEVIKCTLSLILHTLPYGCCHTHYPSLHFPFTLLYNTALHSDPHLYEVFIFSCKSNGVDTVCLSSTFHWTAVTRRRDFPLGLIKLFESWIQSYLSRLTAQMISLGDWLTIFIYQVKYFKTLSNDKLIQLWVYYM